MTYLQISFSRLSNQATRWPFSATRSVSFTTTRLELGLLRPPYLTPPNDDDDDDTDDDVDDGVM